MNFKSLRRKAEQMIEKRGGNKSVKEDAQELMDIAKGQGTMGDKAKRAGEALKEPGAAKAPDQRQPPADEPLPPADERQPPPRRT